jgi:hypothetical protein
MNRATAKLLVTWWPLLVPRIEMKTRFRMLSCFLLLCGSAAWANEDALSKRKDAKTSLKREDSTDSVRAGDLLSSKHNPTEAEGAYIAQSKATRHEAPVVRQRNRDSQPAAIGKDKIGLKPLNEMSADDRYKGQDGGLYGGNNNEPPEEHRRAAAAVLNRIEPLNAMGRPAKNGAIGFISISMSNATMEFSTFKQLADADLAKSPRVKIVDCAQGGRAMAEWVDPQARPWQEAMRRLAAANVAPQQVQVAWIKLANKYPHGDLAKYGKKLANDTTIVIQNATAKFPNLRVAYLSSRIYGGYSGRPLNPEPYAYESAFVVRWLIQRQIKGDEALNYDVRRAEVRAPLLLWGPYLWADGVTPRKTDGLVYRREDLEVDGTHPSSAGREKVAKLLLNFFKTDPLSKPWFTR